MDNFHIVMAPLGRSPARSGIKNNLRNESPFVGAIGVPRWRERCSGGFFGHNDCSRSYARCLKCVHCQCGCGWRFRFLFCSLPGEATSQGSVIVSPTANLNASDLEMNSGSALLSI